MALKYLSISNLSTVWTKIKAYLSANYQPKGSYSSEGHTHDSRYYTESEVDTKLSGKSDTSHNHDTVYLGINAKASSASSADSVSWNNVSGRPTAVSSFTNDSGYITSSGSCNYATYAGSAPANGGASTSAEYLNPNSTLQYGVNRLQYFNIHTSTTSGAGNIANPTSDWYHHIIQSHANGSGYYFDIASHFHGNNVYYRRITGGVESGWIKFIDSDNIGSQSVNYANSAGSATNTTYANWLRTSSHSDHLFHTEWDGSYFWTYVTAGDGGYRAVRVARSDSSYYAERSMNNGAFYISGYQIYVG